MRAAWALLLALAACEDTSRARDRPRLEPKNRIDRSPVVDVPDRSSIVVTLATDGSAVVDGTGMNDVELERMFREAFVRAPDTNVRIVTAPDVEYRRLVQVMDLATTAGLTSVGLETH